MPSLVQRRSSGGNPAREIFKAGSSQRKRPLLETMVVEKFQNSLDQKIECRAS